MNEAQPVIEAMWWMPYVSLFIAIDAAVRAVRNAHHALCLWYLRDHQISDPAIAEALNGIKPPRYWLHALAFAAASAVSMYYAITWPHFTWPH